MAGDDDEVFMTRSLNVTPKTTEQRLTARSGKSKANVASLISWPTFLLSFNTVFGVR